MSMCGHEEKCILKVFSRALKRNKVLAAELNEEISDSDSSKTDYFVEGDLGRERQRTYWKRFVGIKKWFYNIIFFTLPLCSCSMRSPQKTITSTNLHFITRTNFLYYIQWRNKNTLFWIVRVEWDSLCSDYAGKSKHF